MKSAAAQASLAVLAAATAGCEARAPMRHASTAPSPVVLTRQQDLKVDPSQRARPVVAGALPLAYLIETAGDVRVVDATAATQIAQTSTSSRALISVSRNGINVGSDQLLAGPLPADHVYEIYLDPVGGRQNFIRTDLRRSAP